MGWLSGPKSMIYTQSSSGGMRLIPRIIGTVKLWRRHLSGKGSSKQRAFPTRLNTIEFP